MIDVVAAGTFGSFEGLCEILKRASVGCMVYGVWCMTRCTVNLLKWGEARWGGWAQ